jgi:hypothetical protein
MADVVPVRVNHAPIKFRWNARFFYVPSLEVEKDEGVWHIRTQTRARSLSGADLAYVYRPGYRTRCSGDQSLLFFDDQHQIMPLRRYVDHHADPGSDLRADPRGLGEHFHLRIQDASWPTGCVNTDNRKAFGRLKTIYGFDEVERTEAKVATYLGFSTTAQAARAPRFAGLSSEFAYHNAQTSACFGFAAPRPTVSTAASSNDWGPTETEIVIKRLRGRSISRVLEQTVTWSP